MGDRQTMKNRLLALVVLVAFSATASAQYTEQDIRDYIVEYQEVAIQKMVEYKIPASITIAQGIFESACGKSRLATQGNNHFGIKCHEDWSGDTILVDDDELQECFRKYPSVAESFTDHSLFLVNRRRYANLFTLDITDYESWARTLKADGYATNPQYADRLISLIQRFDIAKLDTICQERQGIHLEPAKPMAQEPSTDLVKTDTMPVTTHIQDPHKHGRPKIEYKTTPNNPAKTELAEAAHSQPQPASRFKVFTADQSYPSGESPFTYRKVFENNNTFFVVAEAGDTYESIATDVQVSAANLRKFNDTGKAGQPIENEIVYIETKAKNNEAQVHVVESGETLRYISQRYAVQLAYIFKYNAMDANTIIQPGDKILLKR